MIMNLETIIRRNLESTRSWRIGVTVLFSVLNLNVYSASAQGFVYEPFKDGLQTPNVKVKITVTAIGAIPVPASNPRSTIQHFVTPKGEANDIVIITAAIDPNTGIAPNQIDWDGATKDALNSLQATVSKAEAGRHIVKIKSGNDVLLELRVWVVWATAKDTLYGEEDELADPPFESAMENSVVREIWHDYNAQVTAVHSPFMLRYSINPITIFTDPEKPSLATPEKEIKPALPPSVPKEDTEVYAAGKDLGTGAALKWDASRQLRIKLINPNNIDLDKEIYKDEIFHIPMWKNYLSWPDGVIGNDDTDDENTNDEFYDKLFTAGKIRDTDDPRAAISNDDGAVGDTVELRRHWREFARLEIGGTWYRISDFYFWRQHAKFKKVSEAADNKDHDGDGDKTGQVWIDNGSDHALDNAGW